MRRFVTKNLTKSVNNLTSYQTIYMMFKNIQGTEYETVCDKKSVKIRQFSLPGYMTFKKIREQREMRMRRFVTIHNCMYVLKNGLRPALLCSAARIPSDLVLLQNLKKLNTWTPYQYTSIIRMHLLLLDSGYQIIPNAYALFEIFSSFIVQKSYFGQYYLKLNYCCNYSSNQKLECPFFLCTQVCRIRGQNERALGNHAI